MKSVKKRRKDNSNCNDNIIKEKNSKQKSIVNTGNQKKKRTCLMCGKMFSSVGSYNRRCPKCTNLVNARNIDKIDTMKIHKISPQIKKPPII